MADSYRYRCGECGHRTSWGRESQGQQAIEAHYAQRHPQVIPGGMAEFREGSAGCGCGSGCLMLLGIAVLLALIAAVQH
jgi:hypothetical protein